MLTLSAHTGNAKKILQAAQKQVAFAKVNALNSVAFKILMAERAGIVETFRNPRPFTVANNFYTRATKAKPFAIIGAKPRSANYLAPFEFGGDHYLPNRFGLGRVLLVPVGIKTDAYGQLPAGAALKWILDRPDVFIGTVKGVNGVWQRIAKPAPPTVAKSKPFRLIDLPPKPVDAKPRLKLLIRIEENRAVHKHLNFEARGMAIYEDEYPKAFEDAFAKAMRTARG